MMVEVPRHRHITDPLYNVAVPLRPQGMPDDVYAKVESTPWLCAFYCDIHS
jgi:hypothetical protein